MTAPSATTRSTPLGIFLKNGYQSLVTLSNDPDISIWEKDVTPLSMEGGEPVDITTQHNTQVMTKAARALVEYGEAQMTVAYDPDCYDECRSQINNEQTITITFPDGSTLAFYGYLRNFVADGMENGTQPTATCSVVCTNWDPVNNVEEVPVMTEVAGT